MAPTITVLLSVRPSAGSSRRRNNLASPAQEADTGRAASATRVWKVRGRGRRRIFHSRPSGALCQPTTRRAPTTPGAARSGGSTYLASEARRRFGAA